MEETGIGQSELARRIGISQQAIGRLLSGDVRGTKHILAIAREVATTPAYLMEETDDPTREEPDALPLSHEQLELIECYDRLSRADQQAFLQLARSLAGRAPQPPPPPSRVQATRAKKRPEAQ
jgi:transcriptional regulator with XRE-family HTH domain